MTTSLNSTTLSQTLKVVFTSSLFFASILLSYSATAQGSDRSNIVKTTVATPQLQIGHETILLNNTGEFETTSFNSNWMMNDEYLLSRKKRMPQVLDMSTYKH